MITLDVICGIDFWEIFGISVSLGSQVNELNFEEDSSKLKLSSVDRSRLKGVIDFFPSFDRDGLGMTKLIEHSIDTGNTKPIKQRQYPLSPAREKLLCAEIDRMIKLGVIEEAPASSWSSPIVLIDKPDKVRFCLDSRKVNDVPIKDSYPISNLEPTVKPSSTSSLHLKNLFQRCLFFCAVPTAYVQPTSRPTDRETLPRDVRLESRE